MPRRSVHKCARQPPQQKADRTLHHQSQAPNQGPVPDRCDETRSPYVTKAADLALRSIRPHARSCPATPRPIQLFCGTSPEARASRPLACEPATRLGGVDYRRCLYTRLQTRHQRRQPSQNMSDLRHHPAPPSRARQQHPRTSPAQRSLASFVAHRASSSKMPRTPTPMTTTTSQNPLSSRTNHTPTKLRRQLRTSTQR